MDAAAEESKETSYQEGAGQPEQQKIEMFDKEFGDEPGVKIYSTQSGKKRKIN